MLVLITQFSWQRFLCVIFLFAILHPFSAALVSAFSKVMLKRELKEVYFNLACFIVSALILGIMALLPKCEYEETVAPNGQTSTEHYGPRF